MVASKVMAEVVGQQAFPTDISPNVQLKDTAAATDGGHEAGFDASKADLQWGLISPGVVNLHALEDFASVALNDMTIIGKAVTTTFYGKPPKYSHWNGCSTGGRQGLMMAQRYPEAYDDILAVAPALNMLNLTGWESES